MDDKQIIFISNIAPLNKKSSSTDIMTYNLIFGLNALGKNIFLIAICQKDEEKDLMDLYENITEKIFFFNTKWEKGVNKYKNLFYVLSGMVFKCNYYNVNLKKSNWNKETILISHSPSIESIYITRAIKKMNPTFFYIQYWSDPYTLSSINIDEFNYKRYIHKAIEQKVLSYADDIVYGTKVLLDYQKKLFPKIKSKMRYIDISYTPLIKNSIANKDLIKDRILYAGNFHTSIRNIVPLLEAVESMNGEIILDIFGNGDIDLSKYKYVSYKGIVSPEKMKKIESKYKNIICLMNLKGSQIPGKTFYNMNSKQNIIVLLDGNNCTAICEYLISYNRFLMCENIKESIVSMLTRLEHNIIDDNHIKINYSPERIARALLNDGNRGV